MRPKRAETQQCGRTETSPEREPTNGLLYFQALKLHLNGHFSIKLSAEASWGLQSSSGFRGPTVPPCQPPGTISPASLWHRGAVCHPSFSNAIYFHIQGGRFQLETDASHLAEFGVSPAKKRGGGKCWETVRRETASFVLLLIINNPQQQQHQLRTGSISSIININVAASSNRQGASCCMMEQQFEGPAI